MTPPSNKGRKFPPEPLTRDEVRRLLAETSTRSSSGIRLRAIIAVMFGCGLRLAETLALDPRDYDPKGGTVRVRQGKGGKSRLVGIDPYAAALLDMWMGRRAQLGLSARHRVFATYETGRVGRPLQQRYVRLALERAARRAGIDKRVHPHGLRHSFAFDMAQRGTPTHALRVALGHSSLATTDRYVNHLMPAEVIDTMRDRAWGE
jgi:integrase